MVSAPMDRDLKDSLDRLLKLATDMEKRDAAEYLHGLVYHAWIASGDFPVPRIGGCPCYERGHTQGRRDKEVYR